MNIRRLYYLFFFLCAIEAISNDKILYWPDVEGAEIYQKNNIVAYRYHGTDDYDAFAQTGRHGQGRQMLPNGKSIFDELEKEFLVQYEPSEDFMREKEPDIELG
jgi:hypothetical protein